VVLYHAAGCHLCERARGVLAESGVAFEEIDITGDPQLEAAYREWLPVVEIDGERAFVYYVDPEAFRRKVGAQT
jgi:glutaredoxin